MQKGQIQSIARGGRYTYIHLTDGRSIKGKWNPAWGFSNGDNITWTTYGSWNPNEWYDKVFVSNPRPAPRMSRNSIANIISKVQSSIFRSKIGVIDQPGYDYPTVVSAPGFSTVLSVNPSQIRYITASYVKRTGAKSGNAELVNLCGPNGGNKATVAVHPYDL